MKAMILAAGEGTRLRPLTLDRPKPMLPVNGRPAMEWLVIWLQAYGIHEIAINLHYRPETVCSYFGDGSRFGVKLTYSIEPALMGSAGGMKKLESFFTSPFVLIYGDVLTDLDLTALMRFHLAKPETPHVTLSLTRTDNPTECGIVALDPRHRVTRFVEKPPREEVFSDLTNAGILILDPEILAYIPEDHFYDVSYDLLPQLMAREVPLYGWLMAEKDYLIDIGTPEKYERAQREWPTPALRHRLQAEQETP